VAKTCSSFLRYLRKKRILVQENEEEANALNEAFYKEGSLINEYSITGIITIKRYIDIYTAIDGANKRKCVIKLLNRTKIPDEKNYNKEVGYLQREYELLRRAKEVPHISQAYQFDKDKEGNAYIALEWIDGKPITHYVKENKALTQQDYFLTIRNMLHGFALLHEIGTVHGDVHSSNVMVTGKNSVKIIDLGLSINKEIEENQVLKYGGVDYYMPPERINTTSAKKYLKAPDYYSDVYQLGLLMYAALYHTLPYKGFIWEELSTAIKKGNPTLPDKAASGFAVSENMKNIILKCLQTAPENRYANAAGILKEYDQYAFKEKSLELING
jgi:serine/threonine-protein kinase